MNIYAVIIAGGRGKRFWPQSRIKRPKYLLRLPGQKRTLLQHTASRLKGLVQNKNIIVVTNRLQYKDVRRQLPQIDKRNIIPEPLMKNSAAAIGLAATIIENKDPNAIIITLPADNIVKYEHKFRSAIKSAVNIARAKNGLVTIGIKPTYPATGFGYIKTGRRLRTNIFKADKFIEKPNLKKAKVFVRNRNYLWNSGIFISKTSVMLKEIERYMPTLARGLKSIRGIIGTAKFSTGLNRYYKKFPDLSIDYGVMEKSKKVYVIKSTFIWYDIGSWKNLYGVIKSNTYNNIVAGTHLGIDTKDSIIISRKSHLIGTIGLKNVIIINTDNATLVCNKEDAELVKGLVNKMEKRGLRKFL